LVIAQAREIESLQAVNAELAGRLARVERLVSRNSGNSSMPPSKDGEPGKTPPDEGGTSRRRGRDEGRKRGKQPGAAGASLAWREDPDERVDRFPRVAATAAPSWLGPPIWGSVTASSRPRSR